MQHFYPINSYTHTNMGGSLSMIGIFDPVSRPKTSRNPDGYVRYPACNAYYQSRISPPFCFNFPNTGLQIRQIPQLEKPIMTVCVNRAHRSFSLYISDQVMSPKVTVLSFSVAAPTLWNALPVSLHSIKCMSTFKSNLKTSLFKLAFNIS